jgi:carboxyl-terminal processing protease
VSALLKGSAGTEVSIRVERYGTAPTLYTFKRETITQEPVPFYGLREDGIGYIYLESFTDKAGAQVRSALQNLLEKEAKGIILDLRGNGGGLLMEAVKIVSLFVEGRDTLVTTRTRNGVIQDVYKANGKPIAANLPLAVLVDENSASASEIVAGSLQDLDRAVILGEPSFGKGLVQQVHPLPFGAQMKVTIAKYYTPSGRCIQKINYDRDESGDRLAKAATKTFTTRGGRTVEDGNGIAPDSLITNEYFPEIIAALGSKGLDLKYAGRALSTLPKDASPLNFALSETQWKEFLSFLNEADFSYTSVSERRLQELEEDAEFMDYLESEDIKALKEVVAKRKNNVLVDEQEEIKDYLADYLVSKNFDLAGSLERGMEKDQIIKQAAQILQNANTMKDLLSVK